MTPLEVYVYIDFPSTYDSNIITKCIEVYLKTQLSCNEVVKFQVVEDLQNIYTGDDIVKKGLSIFVKLYEQLKLKTTNETWFIMMGNGNIRNLYRDVSVLLLNKNPTLKECCYVISRNQLSITRDMSKAEKLENIKRFTKDIGQLINSQKVIKYNNVT